VWLLLQELVMSVSVRISDQIYEAARRTAKAKFRSIP